MSETDWKPNPKDEAADHWLPLIGEVDEQGLYWWSATVKWDGCIDLHRAHNVPFGIDGREKDHMAFTSDLHICDLDELIERLQKLKAAAVAHFGEGWPG